ELTRGLEFRRVLFRLIALTKSRSASRKMETPMKFRIVLSLAFLLISTFASMTVMAQNGNTSMLQPPTTEKKPKVTEINGDRLVDNYFWLREKTNPAVIAHLEAENAYAAGVMKPTEALQE